jgi:hypothetical protein
MLAVQHPLLLFIEKNKYNLWNQPARISKWYCGRLLDENNKADGLVSNLNIKHIVFPFSYEKMRNFKRLMLFFLFFFFFFFP